MPRVYLGPNTRGLAQTALQVVGLRQEEDKMVQHKREFEASMAAAKASQATDRDRLRLEEMKLGLAEQERGFRRNLDLSKEMRERAELSVEYGLRYDPVTRQWEADPDAPPVGGIAGRKAKLDALKYSLDWMKTAGSMQQEQQREARMMLEDLTKRRDSHYRTSNKMSEWLALSLEHDADSGITVTPAIHAQREAVIAQQSREWSAGRALDKQIASLQAQMGLEAQVAGAPNEGRPMPGEPEPSTASQPAFEPPVSPRDLFMSMEVEAKNTSTPQLKREVMVAIGAWDTYKQSLQRSGVDPDLYLASLVQELKRRGETLPPAPPGMSRTVQQALERASAKFYGNPTLAASLAPEAYPETYTGGLGPGEGGSVASPFFSGSSGSSSAQDRSRAPVYSGNPTMISNQ